MLVGGDCTHEVEVVTYGASIKACEEAGRFPNSVDQKYSKVKLISGDVLSSRKKVKNPETSVNMG